MGSERIFWWEAHAAFINQKLGWDAVDTMSDDGLQEWPTLHRVQSSRQITLAESGRFHRVNSSRQYAPGEGTYCRVSTTPQRNLGFGSKRTSSIREAIGFDRDPTQAVIRYSLRYDPRLDQWPIGVVDIVRLLDEQVRTGNREGQDFCNSLRGTNPSANIVNDEERRTVVQVNWVTAPGVRSFTLEGVCQDGDEKRRLDFVYDPQGCRGNSQSQISGRIRPKDSCLMLLKHLGQVIAKVPPREARYFSAKLLGVLVCFRELQSYLIAMHQEDFGKIGF